jgi:hypothetical protein
MNKVVVNRCLASKAGVSPVEERNNTTTFSDIA